MGDQRFECIELSFGVFLVHVGVGVPVYHDWPGNPLRRRLWRSRRGQAFEFGGGIGGHYEPRVGSRRQPKSVLYLLNCAFVRFAGTSFEVAQAHDAYAGHRREVGQRPVARLTQFSDRRACRFAAHRAAPAISGYYTAVYVLQELYVFVTVLLPNRYLSVYASAYVLARRRRTNGASML